MVWFHVVLAVLVALSAVVLVANPVLASGIAGASSFNIKVGGEPEAMAIDPNGDFAYVIYLNSSKIRIVDLRNHAVSTIHVGQNLTNLAVTPNGTDLYLTSSSSEDASYRSVYVVATRDNKVIRTINVGGSSSTVAASPNGRFVYVTTNSELNIISTSTQSVMASIALTNGFSATNIAVSANGATVYVATSASLGPEGSVDSQLDVIDVTDRKVITTLDQGKQINNPCGLVTSPSVAKVYESTCAATSDAGEADLGLVVLDEKTNRFETGIDVNGGFRGIAISPNGEVLYAASEYSGGIDLIDTTTVKIIRHLSVSTPTVRTRVGPLSLGLEDLSISRSGRYLYASNFTFFKNGTLSAIKLPPGG